MSQKRSCSAAASAAADCRERVRVDLDQREMAEREAQVTVQPALDEPDLLERQPRVRALVVAVLDDQATGRRAADVVDRTVQRLHLPTADLLTFLHRGRDSRAT